jgi:hypothetical protein
LLWHFFPLTFTRIFMKIISNTLSLIPPTWISP